MHFCLFDYRIILIVDSKDQRTVENMAIKSIVSVTLVGKNYNTDLKNEENTKS